MLLVVNTASECGFTPQLAGLQALWSDYRERGLVVVGFPSNQFGAPGAGQRTTRSPPSASAATASAFPLMAKVEVNGPGAHPLWRWLGAAAPGLLGTRAVKWNFTKFLVGRDGRAVRRFAPAERPEALRAAIEAALAA